MVRLGPVRDWRFTVGAVSGGHFLSHFYNLALPPLFPMLREEFVLSNTELGVLVAAMSIAGFIQVPMGDLVDRVGAKPVFVAGIAVTSVCVGLIGTASTYLAMVAFSLVAGIGQATFHPADYTLLDAVTTREAEGKSFGLHTFGGYAGFAVAPLVVGGIGFAYGWRLALIGIGIAGVAYAAFVLVAMDPGVTSSADGARNSGAEDPDGSEPEPSAEADRSYLDELLQPGILIIAGLYVVMGMATVGIKTFTPLLGVDSFGLTEPVGNTVLTAYFTFTAVSVLIGGVLADRFDNRRLILGAATTVAVLMWVILAGWIPVTPTTGIGMFAVLGLFAGLIFPARDRLVNSLSSAGSTGKSFGLAYTGGTLGASVSPILLGAVIDVSSTTLAFAFIGGFFLVGGLLMLPLRVSVAGPTAPTAGD